MADSLLSVARNPQVHEILKDPAIADHVAALRIEDITGVKVRTDEVHSYRRITNVSFLRASPYPDGAKPLPQFPAPVRNKTEIPSWAGTPGFEVEGDQGVIYTKPRLRAVPDSGEHDDAEELREFGFDPEIWEVAWAKRSNWQASNGDWLESRKLTVRKRDSRRLVLENVNEVFAAYAVPNKNEGRVKERTVVIAMGDQQVGKVDGGGSESLVVRYARILADVATWLRDTGGCERLILVDAGDCLTGDTEIVTRQGIVRIGDVAGQEVEVKDANRSWVKVRIKAYGKKPITRVTWKSRKAVKVTTTSNGHEWILKDGQRVRTEDLRPGMAVRKSALRGGGRLPKLSQTGVQSGFIFGDGSNTENGARAIFCGTKDTALLPWFPGVEVSEPDGKNQRRTAARFPSSWKLLPKMTEGSSYLLGWLAGYFAADGCVDQHGGAHLSSANRDNLEFVRSLCAVLGLDTYPIREVTERSSGRFNDNPLYAMSFGMRSLPDEFFIIPEHRLRINDRKAKALQTVSWVVESVESTGREEETFCCEVPTTQSFLLADGLLTSNCIEGVVSQNGRLITRLDLSVTEQVRLVSRMLQHKLGVFAPLADKILSVHVPGNHDEPHRIAATRATDSWAIQAASSVADALALVPGYEHVDWLFPEDNELVRAVSVGTEKHPYIIAVSHGHKPGKANQMMRWWSDQSLGRRPAGEADLLITGHLHHLRIEQSGYGRTWIQLPALDGGSEWYRDQRGDDLPAGVISLEIDPSRAPGWHNLRMWT